MKNGWIFTFQKLIQIPMSSGQSVQLVSEEGGCDLPDTSQESLLLDQWFYDNTKKCRFYKVE